MKTLKLFLFAFLFLSSLTANAAVDASQITAVIKDVYLIGDAVLAVIISIFAIKTLQKVL